MRKPDLYVVARFLDVLMWKNAGIKKTNLQMSVRLNYQTFLKYLKWLEKHELLEIVTGSDGNDKVVLTKKGIEAYKRLVEWIKETVKELKI